MAGANNHRRMANKTAIEPAIRNVKGIPIKSAMAPIGSAPMGVRAAVIVNMLMTLPCRAGGVPIRSIVLLSVALAVPHTLAHKIMSMARGKDWN